MTMEQLVLGILVATGFFVSAIVSRFFRRMVPGTVIGGVCGIAVSVAVLFYGLDDLLTGPPAEPAPAPVQETDTDTDIPVDSQ